MRLFNGQLAPALLGIQIYLSLLAQLVVADWQYKSRPDLSPPILNITVSAAQGISPGYIFVAPYSGRPWSDPTPHGPLQPAPYIFTAAGELVWSGFGYYSGWAMNFQAVTWKGKNVIFAFEGSRTTHGHSHGHAKILGENYETIREIQSGGHDLLDLHEFHILDEKTTLMENYVPRPCNLRRYGVKPESQWIVEARFQELDIESGRLLFEWRSLDHVLPDETVRPISKLEFGTGYNSSDAIDYFHINSVDRDSENNYLLSGRHTSTIYKVNGTSGEIIWRLGGKYSNFTLGPGVEFGLQHHARYISGSREEVEVISLFDNSGAQKPGKIGEYESRSSGKILSLNTETWTASLIQAFPAPDGIFAFSQGSNQILSNGNAFVNWGSGGAVTEFSPEGEVNFHAYLESGQLWANGDVQNYRGFKFNWTGVPNEQPAVVALKNASSTVIYASWNGDTETKSWRFYGLGSGGVRKFLGEETRDGFETSFRVKSGDNWHKLSAEAVAHNGTVLKTSDSVRTEDYIGPYVHAGDEFKGRPGGGFQVVLAGH